MNLKKDILDYMERTGLKPYEIAKLANVSSTSVYRFLKGERGLLLVTAQKLQKVVAKWQN